MAQSQFEANLQLSQDSKIEDIEKASLEEIWLDESLHRSLKVFATAKFAEENILFLEEVLEMKTKNDMPRIKKIYSDYIAPNSEMEVNLISNTKKDISEKIKTEELDLSVFDEAIDELSKLIREGILNDFISNYIANMSLVPKTLESGKKRVVIVGGGFLGTVVAMALDQMPRFEVVLIDSKEYFEYTPAIISSMVNPSMSDKVKIPYSTIVKNTHLHIGCVDQVTKEYLVAGNHKFPFNYAIFATGSSYTSHFKGYNFSTSYRTKRINLEFKELEAAEKILVIGGGFVGVEIATEIATTFPNKKITIVEANGSLLKRTPVKAREIALTECRKLGIDIVLGERVLNVNQYQKTFETNKGRTLSFDKVYIATGPTPNSSFLEKHYPQVLDNRKQIQINYSLQIKGEENMFSGGDVSSLPFEKLAYNATIQGIAIARNICRLEKGKSVAVLGTKGLPKPRSIQYAQVISFGTTNAMLIIRERFVFFGSNYYDFKITLNDKLLSFYNRTKAPPVYLGRFPKPLPIEPTKSKQ